MEFTTKDAPKPTIRYYQEEEIIHGKKFAEKMMEAYPSLVCGVVLSRTPRAHAIKADQIPIVVIIDDVNAEISQKQINAYINGTTHIVALVSPKIHVETIKLSDHFDLLKVRDQTHLDFVRNGICYKDTGFFSIAQTLLAQGRFRPTMESVGINFAQSQLTLKASRGNLSAGIVALYWAAMEAAHAAVMHQGISSPPPSEMARTLKGLSIEKEYPAIMDKLFHTAKAIMHGEATEVNGRLYDSLLLDSTRFIGRMKKLISE